MGRGLKRKRWLSWLKNYIDCRGNIISTQSGVGARDANGFHLIVKIDDDKLYGMEHGALMKIRLWKPLSILKKWLCLRQRLDDERCCCYFFWKWTADNERELPTYTWKHHLHQTSLRSWQWNQKSCQLSGLYDYVSYLKASEQDAARYELALWRKDNSSQSLSRWWCWWRCHLSLVHHVWPWGQGSYLVLSQALPSIYQVSSWPR